MTTTDTALDADVSGFPRPRTLPDPAVVTSILADLLGVTDLPFTETRPATHLVSSPDGKHSTIRAARSLPSLYEVVDRLLQALRDEEQLPEVDEDGNLVREIAHRRVELMCQSIGAGRLDAHLDRLAVAIEQRRDAAYFATLGVHLDGTPGA